MTDSLVVCFRAPERDGDSAGELDRLRTLVEQGAARGAILISWCAFGCAFDALGMDCVFQCEQDASALKVLRHHWPHVPKTEDVNDERTRAELGIIDMISKINEPEQALSRLLGFYTNGRRRANHVRSKYAF